MRSIHSGFGRLVSCVVVFSLLSMQVPLWAFAPDPQAPKPYAPKPSIRHSKALTPKEMRSMQGAWGENPYASGTQKWGVQVSGVDLMTGNFLMSATDLSFEGGYGVPANVTRTYSVNNGDAGPLGKGWTLSVDLRSTAGGLMKSSGAAARGVPVTFHEKPVGQIDKHFDPDQTRGHQIQPSEGVVAVDASGFEETIQKDADGILTTPAWDKNETTPEYELKSYNDKIWEVALSMKVKTPEGTVYTYAKEGEYLGGGAYRYDLDPASVTPNDRTPSNVLKVTSVTDRHGNVTTYSYGGPSVTFARINGAVQENGLSQIHMPNGRDIYFDWSTERIIRARDALRTVDYAYTSGNLTSVTSNAGAPEQKVYSYSYGGASVPENWGSLPVAGSLITSITDPRGMVTELRHTMGYLYLPPFEAQTIGVFTYLVKSPNGIYTYFGSRGASPPPNEPQMEWVWGQYEYSGFKVFRSVNQTLDTSLVLSKGILYADPDLLDTLLVEMKNVNTVNNVTLKTVNWAKTYRTISQDLTQSLSYIAPISSGGNPLRYFPLQETSDRPTHLVTVDTWYNFLGNPLRQNSTETFVGDEAHQIVRSINYAYNGADKYYQQKAVKDQTGRFSFTDYYTSSEYTNGAARGMVKAVFNPKYGMLQNTGGTDWKTTISVADPASYSAYFTYDDKARPIEVQKLQSGTAGQSSTYGYVITHSQYGGDSAPYWGAARYATEDYGTGKINRLTETVEYDYAGRATKVRDAAGKLFETVYTLDGQVKSVTRTDVQPAQAVATYTYGITGSGIELGMVKTVMDNLSSVQQTFNYYDASGYGRHGQVSSVVETRLGQVNSNSTAAYTYDDEGNRSDVTYTTPNGTTKWRYTHYVTVGTPDNWHRAFETLNKLDVNGAPTSEEMHYQYDCAGRLINSAFAQTNQTGHGYESSFPAALRARASYTYDPAGRVLSVQHCWENFTGSTGYPYGVTTLSETDYTYETSRGLRIDAKFYEGSGQQWVQTRWENYQYDPQLDYLTGASYDGGASYTNWSYDAAGNRANSGYAYNNLNRMTTSPGYVYDNHPGAGSDPDVLLGNRKWRNYGLSGAQRSTWDILNRAASICGTTTGAAYTYRADGMRVKKVEGLSVQWNPDDTTQASGYYDDIWAVNKPTTRYYYDGQMAMEEDYTATGQYGPMVEVTRYGLGARGLDYMRWNNSSGQVKVSFPIYDGHGNMIATLARSGSSYTIGNKRTYDAWGAVQSSDNSAGHKDTKGRHCANLGHKQDDESGLIYMRARYYEASTGRFMNEDPARVGCNWYVYCANDCINKMDYSGQEEGPLGLYRYILDFFFGSKYNDMVENFIAKHGERGAAEAVKKSFATAIEQLEKKATLNGELSADYFAEAQEARALGSKDMADALYSKALRHTAYSIMYTSAASQLRMLLMMSFPE